MGKYIEEAISYSENVSKVEAEISTAMLLLDNVANMLGIDVNNVKDTLSYNVIVSNQEIKDELKKLNNDLEGYTGALASTASEIDKRIENENTKIKTDEHQKNVNSSSSLQIKILTNQTNIEK